MKKKTSKADLYSKHSKRMDEESLNKRYVLERLDQSLPLVTDEWTRVEQLLNMITEFAPTDMVMELASTIANYADDQARRGYVLGQEDLVKELRRRVA